MKLPKIYGFLISCQVGHALSLSLSFVSIRTYIYVCKANHIRSLLGVALSRKGMYLAWCRLYASSGRDEGEVPNPCTYHVHTYILPVGKYNLATEVPVKGKVST
ncbi:hypothetical protein F4775DRAFT_42813 [Biscogniauxia sp. FL1348]|nr:hypothetical protein F4775DRAFT_42813 [Biscogniauxia sp. FL1348]